MKEERGITLISLITYVIVLLVVVSVVTMVTNFLIHNMNEVEQNAKGISEINKFDVVFLKVIKQENISIYKTAEDGKYIILEDKVSGRDIQYIYQDNKIYRIENATEKIEVNAGIEKFEISSQEDQINVLIKVEGYETTKQYKLGK